MAQTGFTPIQIYNSSTASATPTSGNLVAGELAINTADGKLFYLDNLNAVQVIAWKSIPVTVISATGTPSSTTFLRGDGSWATPSTTAGSVVVGTTTITSGTSGRILYDNAGTLGELTTTGTGSVVLSTLPTMTVTGAGFTLQDATDTTKQANFDLSTLTTGTTYSYKLPALTGSTLAVLGLAQTWSALQTFSSALTVSSGNLSVTGSAAGIQVTGQTTGTSTIGGLSQTGAITLGQSSQTQTINIGTGNVTNSQTRTINIGTTSIGTGVSNVTIGKYSATVAHTTNINGGTITLFAKTINLTSGGALVVGQNLVQGTVVVGDLGTLTGVVTGSRAFVTDYSILPVFNSNVSTDPGGGTYATPIWYNGSTWRVG